MASLKGISKSARGLCLALAALSLGVSLPACTKKQPAGQPSGAPAIRIGSPVFHFDYKKARSLSIDKADPASGDHWMARVERAQQSPTAFYDNDSWKIVSYSENGSLPDRLANRSLIMHLLDTLSTLHPTAAVDTSPGSDALANFGLNPPRYALSWEVWDEQTQQNKAFRVEIGAPVSQSRDSNRLAYGIFPPDRAVYELDGAALPMLEYIKTFAVLRHQVLSPLASDEVDEIEIQRPGKPLFYAQRDGAVWADKQHRRLKGDVQGFLDRITHLRIENFVDDTDEAARDRTALKKHALVKIVLKDHFSQPTTLRFATENSRSLATASSRPGAIFELYPGALSKLSP